MPAAGKGPWGMHWREVMILGDGAGDADDVSCQQIITPVLKFSSREGGKYLSALMVTPVSDVRPDIGVCPDRTVHERRRGDDGYCELHRDMATSAETG